MELNHLYLFGVPGTLGGASTKIVHLVRLLHGDFRITVVAGEVALARDKAVRRLLEPYGAACVLLKDLPKKLEGVALGLCELNFFRSGAAREAKSRGLRVV
jgi:hypothetical protein